MPTGLFAMPRRRLTVSKGTADVIQKVKNSEYDEAFDAFAAFLFEQYKKKKQVEATQDIEE